MTTKTFSIPAGGEKITLRDGTLFVPPNPIIPFIEGDGIGPEIWAAARPVLDTAVSLAYQNNRCLYWMEVPVGEKARAVTGSLLPQESIAAFAEYRVGIKGPLATPVGGGFRSLNVALRRELDLYACIRPVHWIPGVPSPVRHPEKVDMVIFRENTEDIYAGIEFAAGTEENQRFQSWLGEITPEAFSRIRFPASAGFSIKPISREGSERLVRAAIRYALDQGRKTVTLVHKGNIMKSTEGAFAEWGYALIDREFSDQTYTHRQYLETQQTSGKTAAEEQRLSALKANKVWVNDVITDAAFEQTLTRPETFDVIATMNLNGDYLSDALTAQVGGLGIAPGANLNAESQTVIFEATHGTAPSIAGQNIANPCSLILSGALMLRHMRWDLAADLIERGIESAVSAGSVTFDFQRLLPGSKALSTSDFARTVIQRMAILNEDPRTKDN